MSLLTEKQRIFNTDQGLWKLYFFNTGCFKGFLPSYSFIARIIPFHKQLCNLSVATKPIA